MTPEPNEAATIGCRSVAAAMGAFLIILLASVTAGAQALRVLPVNILIGPGQRATTLTVINEGTSETAIQIRAYAWNQQDNDDKLTSSDEVLMSPPLATIAPGANQVVRIVLRRPPQGREATYRIVLDQIPPAAEPGTVRIVLRMSIPIFAQPATRVTPHVQFHIERDAGQISLVAHNNGSRHETIRDITLWTPEGVKLSPKTGASPYILAGATRRWPILTPQDSPPLVGDVFRLTARTDAGAVDQKVSSAEGP